MENGPLIFTAVLPIKIVFFQRNRGGCFESHPTYPGLSREMEYHGSSNGAAACWASNESSWRLQTWPGEDMDCYGWVLGLCTSGICLFWCINSKDLLCRIWHLKIWQITLNTKTYLFSRASQVEHVLQKRPCFQRSF